MAVGSETNRTEELVNRLFESAVGTLEMFSVYLGLRLKLYEKLRVLGRATPEELADAAGISPRYAREWLEQQAVAGFLDVDEEVPRRFTLPDAHVPALLDPEDLDHIAPFALLTAGIAQVLPEVVEAYRSGGGVPYSAYGADLRDGQGAINRPAFLKLLATEWIPSMKGMQQRLESGSPARVADIGTGQGWAAIGIASTYPTVEVDGFDLDEASIADARENARGAGLDDRVRFHHADAADLAHQGSYDLVCILEVLHDLAHPVAALTTARRLLAPDGRILVADEKVAESFSAPGDEVERMMYGWSILHCLPAALTEEGAAGTGTVMRPDQVREYATAAGLGSFEILDVDNPFFRFYALAP